MKATPLDVSFGDSASLTRTLTQKDIQLFAIMSGDISPIHLDEEYARSGMFQKMIAARQKVKRPRVTLARAGEVEALMRGSLSIEQLMQPVVTRKIELWPV